MAGDQLQHLGPLPNGGRTGAVLRHAQVLRMFYKESIANLGSGGCQAKCVIDQKICILNLKIKLIFQPREASRELSGAQGRRAGLAVTGSRKCSARRARNENCVGPNDKRCKVVPGIRQTKVMLRTAQNIKFVDCDSWHEITQARMQIRKPRRPRKDVDHVGPAVLDL